MKHLFIKSKIFTFQNCHLMSFLLLPFFWCQNFNVQLTLFIIFTIIFHAYFFQRQSITETYTSVQKVPFIFEQPTSLHYSFLGIRVLIIVFLFIFEYHAKHDKVLLLLMHLFLPAMLQRSLLNCALIQQSVLKLLP